MARGGLKHRVVVISAVVAASAATMTTTATAAEVEGPPAGKKPVAAVATASVDYDVWKRDVERAVADALPYIEKRSEDASREKLAIVLDIDNTSLETHFHPLPPTPAVQPVLKAVKAANSKGVSIFFVTARPGIIGSITQNNLKQVGYPVTGLYDRGLGDIFGSVSEFKTAKRAEIESKGYSIIANIGNNSTDLVGGHAESTVKLPDYDGQLS
ncbi:HAD family acid phosphatase [Streptomyces sp. NPDC017056]|uniref:HAD family acid phosphatase n=1 Tax=Streptomyces sp. NPDC017056 TaxID=3364973 RepID=UPI0037A8F59A